jgi:ferredoxin-NADP reductase
VRIDDERTLTSPEFVGNFFFNTLGNVNEYPRAGLLFIDFERGDMLHIAVDAEIIWDGPQLQAFAGAERLLRFHVREVVRNVAALPFRWTDAQPAMQVARTGSWSEADRAQAAVALSQSWRAFNVVKVEQESSDVRSFYLEPADGLGVAAHAAGQYLSLRVPAWAEGGAARRNAATRFPMPRMAAATASARAGVVSSWLHDHLAPGGQIELMGPAGDFTFEEGTQRPVVMLSAGIGITPMIAMLNSVLVNGSRTRHRHPIYFIHGAREVAHPFAVHLQTLAAGHNNLAVHVQRKRIDIDVLRELPRDDYDYYLCGPAGFMQSMYAALRELHVPEQRIRLESFGPSSLRAARLRRRMLALSACEPDPWFRMRRGRRRFQGVGFAIVLAAVVGWRRSLALACASTFSPPLASTPPCMPAQSCLPGSWLWPCSWFCRKDRDRFAGQRPLCQERLPA